MAAPKDGGGEWWREARQGLIFSVVKEAKSWAPVAEDLGHECNVGLLSLDLDSQHSSSSKSKDHLFPFLYSLLCSLFLKLYKLGPRIMSPTFEKSLLFRTCKPCPEGE